jgi:acyl-CoA synthetase (AMP-forming)/AMP-acid ligase II/acyl carrier protein
LCTDRKTLDRITQFAASNGLAAEFARLEGKIVVIDELTELARPGAPHVAAPDDIALVQYSSGSTSEPKGVVLTHRNLLTNIDAIIEGMGGTSDDSSLSWMPLTHDMGLIGFHLTPVIADANHCLMPTALFVRRPGLWLTKAAEKKSTVLCSPNFGYKHLLNNFDPAKLGPLDLSRIRIVFNGAEPISAELATQFLQAFASSDLKPDVMFGVYGLAEASLAVTFPKPGAGLTTVSVDRRSLGLGERIVALPAGDVEAVALARVGTAVAGCEVQIADANDRPLPDATVGRVRIRGASITRGYYGDAAATQAAIASDGWLDTGDLGFFSEGELTITGRIKEIIFVGGQNFYPQDLEAILEKHAGIELGRAALCGLRPAQAATDDVIAFVIAKGELANFASVAKAVRRSINEHAGLAVAAVIPVRQLPKTTSGKVQRFLLVRQYQDGEFADVLRQLRALDAHSNDDKGSLSELERSLLEICQTLLPDSNIGPDDNLFELGTSSLTLAQIYERIESQYPGKLEVTDFFDYPTVKSLAGYLAQRLDRS